MSVDIGTITEFDKISRTLILDGDQRETARRVEAKMADINLTLTAKFIFDN